jgi:hypothetical protein
MRRLEQTQDGEYGGHGLKLSIDPMRITWLSAPLATANNDNLATSGSLASLGDFIHSRDEFLELMTPWLGANCPPIKRISFTCMLLIETLSREEAYEKLDSYLHEVNIYPDSSDFMYRINRKTRIEHFQLPVNRISTWGAMQTQLKLTTDAGQTETVPSGWSACSVQLDINTSEENTEPLLKSNVPLIFQELVALATDIAATGDHR